MVLNNEIRSYKGRGSALLAGAKYASITFLVLLHHLNLAGHVCRVQLFLLLLLWLLLLARIHALRCAILSG